MDNSEFVTKEQLDKVYNELYKELYYLLTSIKNLEA